jgi:hypothetical protein
MQTVYSTHQSDLGEFITIGSLRIRKNLIRAYILCRSNPDFEPNPALPFGVNMLVEGQWLTADFKTLEESEKAIVMLDWIFKKEGQK